MAARCELVKSVCVRCGHKESSSHVRILTIPVESCHVLFMFSRVHSCLCVWSTLSLSVYVTAAQMCHVDVRMLSGITSMCDPNHKGVWPTHTHINRLLHHHRNTLATGMTSDLLMFVGVTFGPLPVLPPIKHQQSQPLTGVC